MGLVYRIMTDFRYKNITIRNAANTEEAYEKAATAFLRIELGQEPTQQEVDTLVADISDTETKMSQFSTFVNQADTEVAWLETNIPNIDTMDATQVRAVVKRLAQENLEIIKALRYIAKRV